MILTVVPNPALDKTVVLPGFAVGAIYRPAEVVTLAGGKGCNFARALGTLGQRSLVVCPVGGYAGQSFLDLAARDGLACDGVVIKAELRTCLTIVDPGHPPTEIYERGGALEAGEWQALLDRIVSYFPQAAFLTLCGSFPSNVPPDALYDLLRRARDTDLPVLLDTSGPQLLKALSASPTLLKINQFEAGAMLEYTIATPQEALRAARMLQKRGARAVVITLGSRGAVGLDAEGTSFGWVAPPVAAVYTTGSGDCLFAGIASALARGESLSEATRLGVACGAANTLHIGAGRLELRQVEQLAHAVAPLPYQR
jgi:1-phosphofructokinase family hexose kinase